MKSASSVLFLFLHLFTHQIFVGPGTVMGNGNNKIKDIVSTLRELTVE